MWAARRFLTDSKHCNDGATIERNNNNKYRTWTAPTTFLLNLEYLLGEYPFGEPHNHRYNTIPDMIKKIYIEIKLMIFVCDREKLLLFGFNKSVRYLHSNKNFYNDNHNIHSCKWCTSALRRPNMSIQFNRIKQRLAAINHVSFCLLR